MFVPYTSPPTSPGSQPHSLHCFVRDSRGNANGSSSGTKTLHSDIALQEKDENEFCLSDAKDFPSLSILSVQPSISPSPVSPLYHSFCTLHPHPELNEIAYQREGLKNQHNDMNLPSTECNENPFNVLSTSFFLGPSSCSISKSASSLSSPPLFEEKKRCFRFNVERGHPHFSLEDTFVYHPVRNEFEHEEQQQKRQVFECIKTIQSNPFLHVLCSETTVFLDPFVPGHFVSLPHLGNSGSLEANSVMRILEHVYVDYFNFSLPSPNPYPNFTLSILKSLGQVMIDRLQSEYLSVHPLSHVLVQLEFLDTCFPCTPSFPDEGDDPPLEYPIRIHTHVSILPTSFHNDSTHCETNKQQVALLLKFISRSEIEMTNDLHPYLLNEQCKKDEGTLYMSRCWKKNEHNSSVV